MRYTTIENFINKIQIKDAYYFSYIYLLKLIYIFISKIVRKYQNVILKTNNYYIIYIVPNQEAYDAEYVFFFYIYIIHCNILVIQHFIFIYNT